MEISDLTFFDTQEEFRNWLKKNHSKATDIWLGYYKKGASKTGITYKQAVDQALCFGWIDGIAKSIDEERYCQRFTPRRKTSIWSQVNIRRYCELKELGLVHPAGEKTFDNRDPRKENLYSFEQEKHELPAAYLKQIKANKKAWTFFESLTPSVKKPSIWWINSAKQENTRVKRLATLIQCCEEGRKIPMLRRKGE